MSKHRFLQLSVNSNCTFQNPSKYTNMYIYSVIQMPKYNNEIVKSLAAGVIL